LAAICFSEFVGCPCFAKDTGIQKPCYMIVGSFDTAFTHFSQIAYCDMKTPTNGLSMPKFVSKFANKCFDSIDL
jgi:hypothetical protein